jgi:CubicO group peptidase (beta-lactamase class C family)
MKIPDLSGLFSPWLNPRHLLVFMLLLAGSLQSCVSETNARLDALLSSLYQPDKPGAAIAVIRDGEVVFKRTYGLSDMELKVSAEASTNFNICSLTKQFTAYSILLLSKDGKLSIDDRIAGYFPDFNKKVADDVTIRHLLTHSSGIRDHYDYVDGSLYRYFGDKDVLDAVEPVDSLYFRPGSAYRYSNTAYCLLSQIIEKVSGQTYPEFIRNNILRPLKMDGSTVIQPGVPIVHRAFGYDIKGDSILLADAGQSLFFSTMGDGGIYTSVDDYLKWIRALLNRTLPDPGLLEQAWSPGFAIDSTRNLSYGFGWFLAGTGADRIIFHTGSNGGFRTIVFIIPAQKYAVVIFSNRSDRDLEDLVHEINRIYGIDDSRLVKLGSLIS